MLNVFRKLNSEGYDYRLNVISNFSADSYASHTNIKDVEDLKASFQHLPATINIIGKLPNSELIELLKNSHVALMPTYADTYGYFVLEAQACGCPVITTDVRALPEINNNECGWVIKVPKDASGNGILKTVEERLLISQTIEEELYKITKEILNNPASIKSKKEKALARIKEHHDPDKHSQRLLDIYQKTQTVAPLTL